MKKTTVASLLFVASSVVSTAFAAPQFTDITSSDFESISKEMSANFTHNSMLGASSMGSVFGFQVGLVGAMTASPKTNDIVKRNADSELPNLYNAGIVAAVAVPFGLGFEAVLFPKTSSSGAKVSSTSLAVKYNLNDLIPVLPVNLAVRGFTSSSKFSFSQTQGGGTASVENKNSVNGLQLLVSPQLPIVEPYAGIGYLTGSNTLGVTGTTIFDPSFSSSQSEKRNVSSVQVLAGVDFNLVFLKIGAEYSRAFDATRYGIKFAFGF